MIVEQRIFSVVCDAEGCHESLEGYESETGVLNDARDEGWTAFLIGESHLCPEHAEER